MLKTLVARFHLPALSLLGLGLGLFATSKYGAGLAGDSMHYLSVAENLLAGRGFTDFAGNPLILFPPLMPVIIAACAWLFRADVFTVAGPLNLILFALNIYLSGLCLRRVFPSHPHYYYAALLIITLSSSNLAMHASVLTDPLFLTFTLLFFLAGESYLLRPRWQPFLALLLIAMLAPLLRYSGFAQVVAGGLIILYAHGRSVWKSVPLAAFFGFAALLPSALWIYLHNYLPYGTWWGTNNASGADVSINFLQSLRKIMYWFVPYRPFTRDGLFEPLIAFILLLLVLVLINKSSNWRAWLRELFRPAFISILILTAVYYSSSILNIQTNDHKALFSDRYFVIIMLPVLALLFTSFEHLLLPHIRLNRRLVRRSALILFVLWLAYPLSKEYKYLRASLLDGEAGYNQYNTRALRESELLANVRVRLQKEPGANLYSNIPPAVWFFTRHLTLLPPAQDTPRTKDEIKAAFAGWPYDHPGYYIWFEPDPFELFMPLNDLMLFADLEMVEKLTDGAIVRVQPRSVR